MRLGLIADVKQAFHQTSIELGKEGGGKITLYESSVWLRIQFISAWSNIAAKFKSGLHDATYLKRLSFWCMKTAVNAFISVCQFQEKV